MAEARMVPSAADVPAASAWSQGPSRFGGAMAARCSIANIANGRPRAFQRRTCRWCRSAAATRSRSARRNVCSSSSTRRRDQSHRLLSTAARRITPPRMEAVSWSSSARRASRSQRSPCYPTGSVRSSVNRRGRDRSPRRRVRNQASVRCRLRHEAGVTPVTFLNARQNAASDSSPTALATALTGAAPAARRLAASCIRHRVR